MTKANLTKKQFESLLKKTAQPIRKSAPKGTETSAAHPSDGYIGKHKSRGKIEGKED